MRPEDFGRFFEEAFDKIEPKDDAQRQKLEKLREKMRESRSKLATEIDEAMEQAKRLGRPSTELRKIAKERREINEEANAAITAAFIEQAELINRISGRKGETP